MVESTRAADTGGLVVGGDSRTAAYLSDALSRLVGRVHVARTLEEARTLLTRMALGVMVVSPTTPDVVPYVELADTAEARYGTRTVLLIDQPDSAALNELMRAHVSAVLCQPVHRAQLETSLRLALSDQNASGTPRTTADRTSQAAGAAAPSASIEAMSASLTAREREVVSMLLQSHRVPAIAARLGISQQTVRHHLKRVFKRTGTRSQQELIDRCRV